MSDIDLAEALTAAKARAAALSDSPSTPVPEAEAVAILRNVAHLLGHNPDAVAENFLKGGPLADLVRAVIGGEARRSPRRGRPRKLAETWYTFIRVVMLSRAGLTLEQAIGQVAVETDTPEATIRSHYERTRKAGARLEDVPQSPIAAAFADPRPKA